MLCVSFSREALKRNATASPTALFLVLIAIHRVETKQNDRIVLFGTLKVEVTAHRNDIGYLEIVVSNLPLISEKSRIRAPPKSASCFEFS